MDVAAKLDDIGRPAWIALSVLGFIIFWPAGLAILAYAVWSGRMGCSWKRSAGRWYDGGSARKQSGMGGWCGTGRRAQSSGNSAFDAYREETLRRLEDEQKEFMDFLERLRMAKDKAEFDQFMTERDRKSPGTDPEPQAQG